MEQYDPATMVFLVIAAFIASFIDSTVGGGGLISTPALLATGMPVSFALGTNKVAAMMGSFTSVVTFWRAGKVQKKGCLMPDASFFYRFSPWCLRSLSVTCSAYEECHC